MMQSDPCDCQKFTKLEWAALEIQKYSPSMATTDCVTMAENLLKECRKREQPVEETNP